MPLVVTHEGTSCNLGFKQIIQMSLVPISRVMNTFLGVRTPVEVNMRVLTSILKTCFFSTLPQYSGFSYLPLRDIHNLNMAPYSKPPLCDVI